MAYRHVVNRSSTCNGCLHHELERLCLYLDGREADALPSLLSESLTMVEKGIPAFYTPRGPRVRVAYRTVRYGVD